MLIAILIIPLLAAATSLIAPRRADTLGAIAVAATFLELVAAAAIGSSVLAGRAYGLGGALSADALGVIVLGLVALVGFIATWHSAGYLKAEIAKGVLVPAKLRLYYPLLHLFLFAMHLAVLASSPIIAWIAIEATTLSTAFLIGFYQKPASAEAAWKYLIVNSVGLLFGFLGTLLFLRPTMAGGHILLSWQDLTGAAGFDPAVLKIAFILVVIGYGTKTGFAPMHTWLPDAHSKAPAPISALLSGVLLNVAFLTVLRFKGVADASMGQLFSQNILVVFGLASIAVAAFIIFAQKNYKRLLAYSSIEHMGIAALGFGFGGAGTVAALMHLIYHSLSKSLLFLSAGNIFLKFSSTKIKKVSGAAAIVPFTAVIFAIGFLAITGTPPFGIFMTEIAILSAGIASHPIAVSAVVLLLALAFVGFFRHAVAMVFGKPPEGVTKGESGINTVAPLAVLAVILIVLGFVMPSPLAKLISLAAASI